MQPLLVLDVVGLTRSLINRFKDSAPNLFKLSQNNNSAVISHVAPAVTRSVQATYLTGTMPRDHGIVANGWYDRDWSEIEFWHQSAFLMQGEKIWEAGKAYDNNFSSAQLFFQQNMFSSNDIAVTPRPAHLENDAILSLSYTNPPELAENLEEGFGHFPLFRYWGPGADIQSSLWIEKAAEYVQKHYSPTLSLVYLPHLDYNLQRLGPNDPAIAEDMRQVDEIVGRLVNSANASGREVVVFSEYGITEVSKGIHINRILRSAGFLSVQKQHTWELLDTGRSRAFAVSDHQVAHVYVRNPDDVRKVKEVLEKADGIERVLEKDEIVAVQLDHSRSGELIALSAPDQWFTYYYWEHSDRAPHWAREVDIHNKPGYDPLELFMDPNAPMKKARIVWRLMKRAFGLNTTIMNFIPFQTQLVKGSHGLEPGNDEERPILISTSSNPLGDIVQADKIKEYLLNIIFSSK